MRTTHFFGSNFENDFDCFVIVTKSLQDRVFDVGVGHRLLKNRNPDLFRSQHDPFFGQVVGERLLQLKDPEGPDPASSPQSEADSLQRVW